MRWKASRVHRLLMLAAMAALLPVGSGCAASGPPDSPASIRGVVTEYSPNDAGMSARIVWTDAASVGEKSEYDAADATMVKESTLWRASEAGGYEEIEFLDIRKGDVVEAWFAGPVAESYPVQARASDVVIVGRYEGPLPVPQGLEPEPAP